MRKVIISSVVMSLLGTYQAMAWTDMAFRGQQNGWGTTPLTYENGIWRGTIQDDGVSGDLFKLYASDGTTWFGNGQSWSHPDAQTVATSGADMDYNGTGGRYYTFTAIDASSLAMAVQETAGAPVSISGFSSEVANGGNFDPTDNFISSSVQNGVNTVDITLNTAPSAGENVYVYYSSDNFASQANSDIVQASGAGTSWSANISAVNGQTINYYVLTSTFSEANLDGVAAEIDVLLRALDENKGSTLSYSVYDLGDSFHIPTQTAGGAGETMLAGSGGTLQNWLGTENEARIYSGNVFQGQTYSADQSSYTLHYQINNGAWQTSVGGFDNTSVNDKYWEAAIDLTSVSSGSVVRYYLEYDYTDSDITFAYSDNGGGSRISGNEALAQNNPFQFQYGDAPESSVPEPAILTMAMCAGVIFLTVHRRKRNRKMFAARPTADR